MRLHDLFEVAIFKRDNPGGDWLKRKQNDADTTSFGRLKGIMGPTTGYFTGPLRLPVKALMAVPGARGEETYRDSGPKSDQLKKQIGASDKFDSQSHPIFIGVNHYGQPYVVEGNHRLAYAAEHGIEFIWTEVRYFNGGEDVEGSFSPDVVLRMQAEDPVQPVTESIEERLYHVTNTDAALSILKMGVFRMTPALGSQAEMATKSSYYFLSTARSTRSKYIMHATMSKFTMTIFVMDRRKLQHNYSVSPVDYWAVPGKQWKRRPDNNEMEERITSAKSNLPIDCVTELHITLPRNDEWPAKVFNAALGYVRDCVLVAKRRGIEPYVYGDEVSFVDLNKSNAIPLSKLAATLTAMKKEDVELKERWPRFDEKPTYCTLAKLLLTVPKWEHIPEKLHSRCFHMRDFKPQIEAEIHNARKRPIGKERAGIDELIMLMRKHKLRTVDELVKMMSDRVDVLRADYEKRMYPS